LLTEQEVSKAWQQLFRGKELNKETFRKAEELLENLRLESPLRHRLENELKELRKLHRAAV